MKTKRKLYSDEVFKGIMDKIPICTVDVIFLTKDKKKTLLFKRNNKPLKNVYFSCGGGLLKNEDFLNCAARKVKEELGLEIEMEKLFLGGVLNEKNDGSIYDGVDYHCADIYFGYLIDEKKAENIKLDNQHSSYKWFDVDNKNLHPWIKEKVRNLISIMLLV